WHLQIPANGLQSACRDTVLADRRTGLRHEDEVIGPSKFRPLAQSEQNGEQRLWNWQISVAAFPAHAAQLTAVPLLPDGDGPRRNRLTIRVGPCLRQVHALPLQAANLRHVHAGEDRD